MQNTNRKSFHVDSENLLENLITAIQEQLKSIDKSYDEIVIACIGTDKVTGDCLGPLVGSRLSQIQVIRAVGTLDNPIHALTLNQFISTITNNQLIIAVDASLGDQEKVGYIYVKEGPLTPGAGVNKSLPQIGDMHITGIVNISSSIDFMSIMTTRLSLVMKMADAIADSLHVALQNYSYEQEVAYEKY